MDSHDEAGQGGLDDFLPPPPPPLPSNVVPTRTIMARPGRARKGKPLPILTNHFRVSVRSSNEHFYHYSVSLTYEDGHPVDAKNIGRRVIDKLKQIYEEDLGKKDLAYDGEKSLFTIGALPNVRNEFTVLLEDISSNKRSPGGESPNANETKRLRRPNQTKTFKVAINFAAKVPMRAISLALEGQDTDNSQEALRVLDIILRQHAAKQGCLLVQQKYFHDNPRNYIDIGGGVLGCRGFDSSFRTSQSGLSLNMDATTTMIVKPGLVLDFLIDNQMVRGPDQIDWAKAKRALKGLLMKTSTSNMEQKIVGLSELPCNQQMFTLKKKDGNIDSEVQISVYDYYLKHKQMKLRISADLPCINVGKSKRPVYFPVEICILVPLQRYMKALTIFQRSSLVEQSRQKPQERMKTVKNALELNNYNANPLLIASGVSISNYPTQVEGRVLPPPMLRVGNGEEFMPQRGRWNFNQKKFMAPAKIENWAVVNFSTRCNTDSLIKDLLRCANMKGVPIVEPLGVLEEDHSSRRLPPAIRVENMFKRLKPKLNRPPTFLLCLLPERKNCDIYGPWKHECLVTEGIVTQSIVPVKVNDQYLTNVLIKINAKLGGLSSCLNVEGGPNHIPLVTDTPTLILGMDVSHGRPGQCNVPSVAAVASSRQWPFISRYSATVRTQPPKVEMIDSLFKIGADGKDHGIICELLIEFYKSSREKPKHIVIFRDGVSESQFNQVLNIELNQIIQACKFLEENYAPKFTVIVAQKRHNTRFFLPNGPDNVPPGTVVDNQICHPRNYDFYICPHAGMIGTSRPIHYHVLLDEIGFSPDDLQGLVHALSYVYQKSTTAVSIAAPIAYAHLAAAQMGQFLKIDDMSDGSSGQGAHTLPGSVHVPEMPRLHKNVCNTMFFC